MTAAPTAPGRGLPVYQPATAVLDGTWSVPFARRPRATSEVRTPITGMLSQTGRAACWVDDSDAGSAVGADGAGIGDGRAGSGTACCGESAAAARPVLPTATATSPAPSASTASRRRGARRSQGRRRAVHKPRVVARTWPHAGAGFGGCVSGTVADGATSAGSQTAAAGSLASGDFTDSQAGSHQSSGRHVSSGAGAAAPL